MKLIMAQLNSVVDSVYYPVHAASDVDTIYIQGGLIKTAPLRKVYSVIILDVFYLFFSLIDSDSRGMLSVRFVSKYM